jgi:hypothetical protein
MDAMAESDGYHHHYHLSLIFGSSAEMVVVKKS